MWKVQKQSIIPYCILTFNCYSRRTYCWLAPIRTVTSNCVILGFRGLSRVELKYGKFWGHLIMLVCFMISKNEWLHSARSVAPFVVVLYATLFESGNLNSYLCFGDACFKSRLERLILSFFMIFIFFQGNCSIPSSHFVSDFVIILTGFHWTNILFCVILWMLVFYMCSNEDSVLLIQSVCIHLSTFSFLWSAACNSHFSAHL